MNFLKVSLLALLLEDTSAIKFNKAGHKALAQQPVTEPNYDEMFDNANYTIPEPPNLAQQPASDDKTCNCDTGMFCNNDIGPNKGFCEPCGDFQNASSCDQSGLPSLGVDACKSQCFGPTNMELPGNYTGNYTEPEYPEYEYQEVPEMELPEHLEPAVTHDGCGGGMYGDQLGCYPCTEGFYCPNGSKEMVMCPAATPFSKKLSDNMAACSGTPGADNQSAPAGCAAGSWAYPGEECKGCSKGFYCPEGATEEMMCPAETPFSNENSTNAGACNGGN